MLFINQGKWVLGVLNRLPPLAPSILSSLVSEELLWYLGLGLSSGESWGDGGWPELLEGILLLVVVVSKNPLDEGLNW